MRYGARRSSTDRRLLHDPLNREAPIVKATILVHGEHALGAEKRNAKKHRSIQRQKTSQCQQDAPCPRPLAAQEEVAERKEGAHAPQNSENQHAIKNRHSSFSPQLRKKLFRIDAMTNGMNVRYSRHKQSW